MLGACSVGAAGHPPGRCAAGHGAAGVPPRLVRGGGLFARRRQAGVRARRREDVPGRLDDQTAHRGRGARTARPRLPLPHACLSYGEDQPGRRAGRRPRAGGRRRSEPLRSRAAGWRPGVRKRGPCVRRPGIAPGSGRSAGGVARSCPAGRRGWNQARDGQRAGGCQPVSGRGEGARHRGRDLADRRQRQRHRRGAEARPGDWRPARSRGFSPVARCSFREPHEHCGGVRFQAGRPTRDHRAGWPGDGRPVRNDGPVDPASCHGPAGSQPLAVRGDSLDLGFEGRRRGGRRGSRYADAASRLRSRRAGGRPRLGAARRGGEGHPQGQPEPAREHDALHPRRARRQGDQGHRRQGLRVGTRHAAEGGSRSFRRLSGRRCGRRGGGAVLARLHGALPRVDGDAAPSSRPSRRRCRSSGAMARSPTSRPPRPARDTCSPRPARSMATTC